MEASPVAGVLSAVHASLILPTYNPGAQLDRTWRELRAFLASSDRSWEVLFVCDGCTDGTSHHLAQLCRESDLANIRVLSHTPNRGKGYAVRRGLAASRGAYCVFADVDLAYGFDDIRRVLEALEKGADLATGSRRHPESRFLLPADMLGNQYRRHLQSLALSAVVRWLLPVTHRDTQAGLKGLSRRAVELLLPRLRCDGFGFDCELLTASTRLGLRVAELPVQVRIDSAHTSNTLLSTIRFLGDLWRIRRTWRAGVREPATMLPFGGAPGADHKAGTAVLPIRRAAS